MGRLVINNAMSVNGAFEAPVPEPDGWLVLDADSNQVSLEQFLAADAMVLGRNSCQRGWPRSGRRWRMTRDLGRVRGPDEQHAQVRGVTDAARAAGVERHPAGR